MGDLSWVFEERPSVVFSASGPMTAGGAVKKTWAALFAASILLVGCGGGAKPDASSSTSPRATPTTTTPAPTTSAAAPTATADPNIPAAARAHTPAGAEAFTKYFFAQLNRSWATADPSLLPPLSEPACKTCGAFTSSAASFRSKNQHYQGEIFNVISVGALGEGLKGQEVLVVGKQEPGAILDQAGTVIERSVAQAGKFVISLRWTGSGWTAVELQVKG